MRGQIHIPCIYKTQRIILSRPIMIFSLLIFTCIILFANIRHADMYCGYMSVSPQKLRFRYFVSTLMSSVQQIRCLIRFDLTVERKLLCLPMLIFYSIGHWIQIPHSNLFIGTVLQHRINVLKLGGVS